MQKTTNFKTVSKVIAFAMPISTGLLINMISSFIAMMMVAKLGQLQLAAGALAVTTNITIITIVAAIFYSIGILISHIRGQGKPIEEIGQVVRNAIWLAIFLTIPSSIALWNIDKVLILFKQDPKLIAIATNYFHFAALSILPILINSIFTQFFTGTNRPGFTMFMAIINLPITVFLSYIFVLGHFGVPQLGLAGITGATLIVQILFSIGVFIYLKFGKANSKYQIFSGNYLPNWHLCKNIFTLGFPIGIQFGAELAAMTISTYLMGYFGVIALAASQVVSQYSFLVVMITLGLSQALSVLISEAYGEKNYELVRQYIFSAITVLTICFGIVFIFFVGFPNTLIKIYMHAGDAANKNLLHLAAQFFVISAITLFIDALRNLFSGALRGFHDSKTPMHVGIITLWGISLPMNYFIGFILHGGPIGLRFGFMSGFIVAAVVLYLRIRKKLNLTLPSKVIPILKVDNF